MIDRDTCHVVIVIVIVACGDVALAVILREIELALDLLTQFNLLYGRLLNLYCRFIIIFDIYIIMIGIVIIYVGICIFIVFLFFTIHLSLSLLEHPKAVISVNHMKETESLNPHASNR